MMGARSVLTLTALLATAVAAHAVPVTLDFVGVENEAITRDLADVRALVLADDADVYLAVGSNAIVHLTEGAEGLVYVATYRDGQAGIDGLANARDLALGPGAAHLYAVGAGDAAVAVFSRDAGTGALTFVEAERQGVGGVTGMAGAEAVTVSPDGAHVYVAAAAANAVAVFTRDGGTGALAFVTSYVNGSGGVSGITAAGGIGVSPDGAHVYVAATPPASGAITTFARNPGTGALTFLQTIGDAATAGALRGATDVAIPASGAQVYVAAEQSDAVATFSRDGGTGLLTFVAAAFDGLAGIDGLDGARTLALSADDANLHAGGTVDAEVAVFDRDAGTGALTFTQVEPVGGRGTAVSGSGASVYTAAVGSVAAWDRDGLSGALTARQLRQNGNVQAVTTSGDGSHAYLVVQGDDAVQVYDRDAGTGTLTLTSRVVQGPAVTGIADLAAPSMALVSGDGAHVYVTAQTAVGAGTVVVFERDGVTGALTFVEAERNALGGVTGLVAPFGLAESPDGANLYVTSVDADSLVVFGRDAVTGALTWVETHVDQPFPGTDGLNGASGVAVSPDGSFVYVGGGSDSEIAIFSRDGGTGALTFVEAHPDSALGGSPTEIVISADGAVLHAAARVDDAVTTFERDLALGTLTRVDGDFDGTFDVDGLNGVRALALSPDEGQLFTAAEVDDAVAVFSRNASQGGALEFVQAPRDGVLGVDGIDGATSVAVSSDGAHVYVAGAGDDAIGIFGVGFGGCPPAPLVGCRQPASEDKAKILIKGDSDPNRVKLVWKWVAKGEPTVFGDFGDPSSTTHYAWCLYDLAGPTLLMRALTPAGDVWQSKPTAHKYKVKFLLPKEQYGGPEGVEKMILKASPVPGKGKAKVQIKGAKATLPTLPLPVPVLSQLQASNGECWQAEFLEPSVQRNDASKFIAKGD